MAEITSSDLAQFYVSGTITRHRMSGGRVAYTEGVAYLAEKANCFWLIDAIASHLATNPKFRGEGQLQSLNFWLLSRKDEHDRGAALRCVRDVPFTKHVVQQVMEYADFPSQLMEKRRYDESKGGVPELGFQIWCGVGSEWGSYTLYLPSEH